MANGPYLGPAVVREIPPGQGRDTGASQRSSYSYGRAQTNEIITTREQWEARAGDWYSVSPTGCWLWIRYTKRGYAFVCFNGKAHRANRVAYELFRGPIPAGRNLKVICRNKSCVNPDHQRISTAKENLHRESP